MRELVQKIANFLDSGGLNVFDKPVAQTNSPFSTCRTTEVWVEGEPWAELDRLKRANLEKLFNSQIATLRDRGVPEEVVETLLTYKSRAIAKASEMTIEEGNIPFLPIIKPLYLGYHGLMLLVRNGSKVGQTGIHPVTVRDLVRAPELPYYAYNVGDGSSTRKMDKKEAEKFIKKQKRSPLIGIELTALCAHTDVLSRHPVCALGSKKRHESWDLRLVVSLHGSGHPMLDWRNPDSSLQDTYGRWCFPSCESRDIE